MRARITLVAMAVAIALGASVQTAPSPAFARDSWSFAFPGDPQTPQPFSSPDWDVLVHNRDIDTAFEPFAAQHGPDCSAPPATHMISTFTDAVFLCKNHVMTSARSQGYAAIYLTPDRMVDFSQETGVVRFSVSTLRTSLRDWIDFWITPYEYNLVAPLEPDLPDLQGPPRDAVHVVMSDTNGETNFYAELFRNHQSVDVPVVDNAPTLEGVVSVSARNRVPYELSISRTHIKFGIPSLNVFWVDADIPPLSFNQGVVQFGHHSYTPEKEPCVPAHQTRCAADTWHWSDFSISPAAPIRMIHGNAPFVSPGGPHEVTFGAPAPAGSNLRFMGQGSLRLSFDGGRSFATPVSADQEGDDPGHMSSYWMPVPAGTQRVLFEGEDDWFARDISIWSRAVGPSIGPTPPPDVTSQGAPDQSSEPTIPELPPTLTPAGPTEKQDTTRGLPPTASESGSTTPPNDAITNGRIHFALAPSPVRALTWVSDHGNLVLSLGLLMLTLGLGVAAAVLAVRRVVRRR